MRLSGRGVFVPLAGPASPNRSGWGEVGTAHLAAAAGATAGIALPAHKKAQQQLLNQGQQGLRAGAGHWGSSLTLA